eukprot:scaffold8005_cov391-Pinguiococcus_pyrenoidosus.AAC.1
MLCTRLAKRALLRRFPKMAESCASVLRFGAVISTSACLVVVEDGTTSGRCLGGDRLRGRRRPPPSDTSTNALFCTPKRTWTWQSDCETTSKSSCRRKTPLSYACSSVRATCRHSDVGETMSCNRLNSGAPKSCRTLDSRAQRRRRLDGRQRQRVLAMMRSQESLEMRRRDLIDDLRCRSIGPYRHHQAGLEGTPHLDELGKPEKHDDAPPDEHEAAAQNDEVERRRRQQHLGTEEECQDQSRQTGRAWLGVPQRNTWSFSFACPASPRKR